MKLLQILVFIMVMAHGLLNPLRALGAGAGSHVQTKSQQQGPNGGKLLTQGNFAVEVLIFESGIAPEMRVYTYHNDQLVTPTDVDLNVVLYRLGDVTDALTFSPEEEYLVSNETIVEPHSYRVVLKASAGKSQGTWDYESFEGRTTLSERVINKADIVTERASSQTLKFTQQLFGVIAPINDRIAHIRATYRGNVTDVRVNTGDRVTKGQTLAVITNASSGASYNLTSPIKGEITERFVNAGEMAAEQMLFEIIDLSDVWVELSAFPENIEKLKVGHKADVFDMHHHKRASGEVSYISPVMTGGHIARARILISNLQGHWRPGMHVKADITTGQKDVALAVKKDALQTFRDMPVVFARYANTFEVRMIEQGDTDGNYVEVKSGLAPGTPYVVGNSYLLKADILKDGASHDH